MESWDANPAPLSTAKQFPASHSCEDQLRVEPVMPTAPPLPSNSPHPGVAWRSGLDQKAQSGALKPGFEPNRGALRLRPAKSGYSGKPLATKVLHHRNRKPKTMGVTYYGYRYYDPKNGRWPSRDPIEEEGGLNLYGFVRNNSLNDWDSFGLAGWEDYKIVAKSYIDGVGTVGYIRSNFGWSPGELIRANVALRVFALGAGLILDAFNQYPADDSKDGKYRLFGEIKTKFCCDGDKIKNKDWHTREEGGVELGPIKGTVTFKPNIQAVGDKFEITWFLYGRPARIADVFGMQMVQLRRSTQIWQKGKVTISCQGGEIQKTEDVYKGSRYPTREYWINSASETKINKGPLSSLWSESPTMPGFVAE